MFNPFTWYSEYRLRRLQMQLEAAQAPYKALQASIDSHERFLKQWLDSFKVAELPSTTVTRDGDVWAAEQDRLRESEWEPVPAHVMAELFKDTR